jgi:hypothetical protein
VHRWSRQDSKARRPQQTEKSISLSFAILFRCEVVLLLADYGEPVLRRNFRPVG